MALMPVLMLVRGTDQRLLRPLLRRDVFPLPTAVLQLRQGFGRLIRGHTDRGVVAILDPRLRTKGYGRAFIGALPRCPVAEDPAAVAAFFGNRIAVSA